MQIPHFPESNHPLVQALAQRSDQDLLTLFQRYPEQGCYFAAIFCRYTPVVYTLVQHSVSSPVQADYLFAVTWRHLYYELGGLDLHRSDPSNPTKATLQSWLIQVTAQCINQAQLPPVEAIAYNLEAAPPVLWCYIYQSLDRIDPLNRLILIMGETFRWSETRISAYLRAEGENLAPAEVRQRLEVAQAELLADLPQDIREIYLPAPIGASPAAVTPAPSLSGSASGSPAPSPAAALNAALNAAPKSRFYPLAESLAAGFAL
ncbi:MAG: sigma-70 family RNA polymerase sigma factor [Prochlorothrix sp.]